MRGYFMNKKIIISLIIIAILFLAFLAFLNYENENSDERITLNVSSEGPIPLQKLIKEIRTHEYYQGYDNETVEWMESLGDKYVFVSPDEIVIMNRMDANKIPSIYACDVSLYEIFSADLIERHSLGKGENFKDVYFVKNVEYIREEAHYYDV